MCSLHFFLTDGKLSQLLYEVYKEKNTHFPLRLASWSYQVAYPGLVLRIQADPTPAPNHPHFFITSSLRIQPPKDWARNSELFATTQVKGELVEKMSQTEMKKTGREPFLIHSATTC